MGKFSKFCSERIHRDTDPHVVCKCRETWLTGSREVARCFPDKEKQNFGSLSRSCFAADRARNLRGPAADNVLRVPKFHPNLFTSGGLIAERENTVQTLHKVFPVLGEAIASLPSKNLLNSNTSSTCPHNMVKFIQPTDC